MTNLIFGVVDVPYDNGGAPPPPRKAPKTPKRGRAGKATKAPETSSGSTVTTTTVDVAIILEEKYGVMAVYYEHNQDVITGALVHSIEGALESLYAGGPLGDPFADADQEIAAGFRQWLMQGEIEQLGVPGVPT